MKKVKKEWDLLGEDRRKVVVEGFIKFFKRERGEEMGILPAEVILDEFLRLAGTQIYNMGIEDSKDFLRQKIDGMIIDLDMLKKDQN